MRVCRYCFTLHDQLRIVHFQFRINRELQGDKQ
jgi:hypothetical protein